MASPQEAFLQGHPERKKDGAVLFCAECSFMTMGRLSSKEVAATVTLVLTEKALYEFKGSTTKTKEAKRIEWSQVGALLLSNDRDIRFVVCLIDNSYRTYETFTVTTKKSIVDTIKERCETTNSALPVAELPDLHITRVLKTSHSKRSSRSNVWASLLIIGDKLADPPSEPSTAEIKPRKSNMNEGDWSAGISANSSAGFGGGDRVGGIGNIGPMTLIWRRLESAVQPHLTIVTEDTTALEVIAKLKNNLGTEASPFSALGAPRDSGSAIIALSSVMMNSIACHNLAKLFPSAKASAFLNALEGNLGCGDALVRRWTALSLTLGLPSFVELGFFPNSNGWQQAVAGISSQVRRRENAAIGLLFPHQTVEKEDNVDVGDILLVNSPTNAKEEKPVEKGSRFGMLRVITGKSDTKSSLPSGPATIIESRKASRLNFAFSTANLDGGDADSLAMEPSDRRIRGSLALAWMSRLLDLESGNKDEGIEKSDVQTMFQLLLGKYPDPNAGQETVRNLDFEVETFGATVESPEFFPSIISTLTATRNDDVRCIGLKQMNVLVMRNAPAIRAFLAIPDWQSVVLSSLHNVPYAANLRNTYQEDAYSYTMHLATTLHLAVLGSKSPASEFGPIDKLMGQTIYKIAVNSGWGDPAIAVTRSIFKGIISTLAKQATLPTCTWRHNPMNDEWEELFRLSHLLQTFLFYRPANMCLKDVPILVADASLKASRGENTVEFTDWRSRVNFTPLLNRVQNERLLAAHRQMYAKLGLPIMTAAHRGEETGVHLDESGLCHDRSLVEAAIKLWYSLGITGNPKDDQKKADEHVNKADRSRVMYASNVCRELLEVLRLFDVIDEKRHQVLAHKAANPLKKKGTDAGSKTLAPQSGSESGGIIQGPQRDQVQAIALSKATDFLEKKKKTEANVGFLTKAKTKNQATNLRSNMLQKREVAIRKLGSGSDKLQPQVAATATISVMSNGRTGMGSQSDKIQIRADDVIRTPLVSPSKHDDEKTIFEQEQSLNRADRKTVVPGSERSTVVSEPDKMRRTLVKLRKTHAQKSDEALKTASSMLEPIISPPAIDIVPKKQGSIIISRKRSRAPVCHGCGEAINEEVQEVSKFGHFWHGDCLVCSNCHCNILTKDESGETSGNILETCRYYPLAELLVCSKRCRDAVLSREGEARCPGCMDGFNVNDKAVMACGFSWHVDSQCFRCTLCEIRFDEQTPFFEVGRWPYCKPCLDTKFLHCKSCGQPLLDTDKVVEALDSQFHEKCFACSVCHEPFREDNFYRGENGELFCFNHYLQKRTPPCAACHLPLNHKRGSDEIQEDPVTMAGLTFHRSCFKCSKCTRKLRDDAKPGADEEPNEHGGVLFCPDCYVEEYGLKCRACSKGIRGDILHAGVGKHGEVINWHPTCFVCDECKCPLIEIPFYLVTVGDDEVVPVCFDHYQSRYGNRKCPGCNSFVSPGRSRQMSQGEEQQDPDLDLNTYLKKDEKDRTTSVSTTIAHQDSNPAIMFADAMWHARCLTCDEPGCGASLFDELSFAASNLLKIDTAQGKKYCSEHLEIHLPKCFTCKKGINEFESPVGIMGWLFHDTLDCFRCCKCKAAIEPGQALVKLEDGPAHQTCPPSRRRTGVWKLLKG